MSWIMFSGTSITLQFINHLKVYHPCLTLSQSLAFSIQFLQFSVQMTIIIPHFNVIICLCVYLPSKLEITPEAGTVTYSFLSPSSLSPGSQRTLSILWIVNRFLLNELTSHRKIQPQDDILVISDGRTLSILMIFNFTSKAPEPLVKTITIL